MVEVEWGHGPHREWVDEHQLDELLDQIAADARRESRPQDVQVTVDEAGTLCIVVGPEWSVLSHIPTHLNPPYMVSVGNDPSDDPVTFYVAGDNHSETLRRNTISTEAARAAMRHFLATGGLSPNVNWEEV